MLFHTVMENILVERQLSNRIILSVIRNYSGPVSKHTSDYPKFAWRVDFLSSKNTGKDQMQKTPGCFT